MGVINAATEFHAGASALEILVPKEGLLSFVAHEHVIEAAEFDAVLEWKDDGETPLSLVLQVPVEGLRVLDPDLEDGEREKVRSHMMSADVLGRNDFPVIVFESESIEVRDPAEWVVRGQLTIRDRSAPVAIVAAIDRYADGRLRARGTAELALADFGMQPVTAVGGMMRTGKTVEIRFDFIGTIPTNTNPIN